MKLNCTFANPSQSKRMSTRESQFPHHNFYAFRSHINIVQTTEQHGSIPPQHFYHRVRVLKNTVPPQFLLLLYVNARLFAHFHIICTTKKTDSMKGVMKRTCSPILNNASLLFCIWGNIIKLK